MNQYLILLFLMATLKLIGQETIDSTSVIDGVIIPEHKPTKSIIYMKVLPDIVWNNLDTSTFKKSKDGSNLEIDSLKFKFLDIENQTLQQIHVIDSLKSKIAKIEFGKEQLDRIKADCKRHKLLRDKQFKELNFELIDSLEFFWNDFSILCDEFKNFRNDSLNIRNERIKYRRTNVVYHKVCKHDLYYYNRSSL